MQQQAVIGTDVAHAAELLRQGRLVAIPTETVYGLAGNALDETAVSEIFRVKNRPGFDPLIIHLSAWEAVGDYADPIPAAAHRLAAAFLPGPLTLLLPRRPIIPDLVTAGSAEVAVRIPAHPLTQALLRELDFPLAAPSANPFGYISPTRPEHVAQQLGGHISYILDGGPCEVGVESTIVAFDNDGTISVLRKGGLAVEDLEAVLGRSVEVRPHSSSNPRAPGMLRSHYAPRTPLRLGRLPELLAAHPAGRVGILAFQQAAPGVAANRQVVLSPGGDLAEAARRLFAGLRYLDSLPIDVILAEPLPEQGLGRAINDRLRRAAAET